MAGSRVPATADSETSLAAKLRQHREAAGHSQESLARHAAVSTGTVAKIEQGRTEPTVAVVRRLARALGVQPGALLDEREQVAA